MIDQPRDRHIIHLLNELAEDRMPGDRDLWPDIQRRVGAVTSSSKDDRMPLVVDRPPAARQPLVHGNVGSAPPGSRPRRLARQWVELGAAVLAFVLVGALLVVLFRDMTGGSGEPAAGPTKPEQRVVDLLWVVSTVYGDESGFDVETTDRVAAYDASSGAEVYAITAGGQADALLSPDGSTLYVASISTTTIGDDLIAYDARTGDELWRAVIQDRVHYLLRYGPSSLALSPDGLRLYIYSSVSPDRAWLQVFDTVSREVVSSIDAPYCAADMRVSPDGRTLYVICQAGGWLQAIDLTTGQPVQFDQSLPYAVAGSAVSPDGRMLYTVGRQQMETWATTIDLDARAVTGQVALRGNPLPARLLQLVTLSVDGRFLFVGTNSEALPQNHGPSSNAVLVYDTLTWDVAQIATSLPITAQTLAPAPDGRGVFAANNTFREGTSIPMVATILRLELHADPTIVVERPREEIIRMFTFRAGPTFQEPTPTPSVAPAGNSCPVTPYGEPPPDASQVAFSNNWLAGDGLWAGLGAEAGGSWGQGTNRVLWWRWNPQPLTVTGQRLDDEARALEAHIFDGYEGMSHQIMALDFPAPGCWQVTGVSGDSSLTFVVDVVPLEETAAYQRQQKENAASEAQRQQQMPYPVPYICAETGWLGPRSLNIGVPSARYRIDGDGLTMGQDLGLLTEGSNTVYWIAAPGLPLSDAVRGAIVLSGTHGLDPYATPRIRVGSQLSVSTGLGEEQSGRAWTSSVSFPTPGCWTIHASLGPYSLDAVVYVYPWTTESSESSHEPPATPAAALDQPAPDPNSGIPWLTPEQEDRAQQLALANPLVQALLADIPLEARVGEVGLIHNGPEQIGGVVRVVWDTPVMLDGEWLMSNVGCMVAGSNLPYWMSTYRATFSNVTELMVHVDLRFDMVTTISAWPTAIQETREEFPEGTLMPPEACDDQ